MLGTRYGLNRFQTNPTKKLLPRGVNAMARSASVPLTDSRQARDGQFVWSCGVAWVLNANFGDTSGWFRVLTSRRVNFRDVMVIISKEVRMLKLSEAGGKPPMPRDGRNDDGRPLTCFLNSCSNAACPAISKILGCITIRFGCSFAGANSYIFSRLKKE